MKKIEINDMLKYKFLSNLNFSVDGKTLVFVLSKMNDKDNNYNSYLYMYKNNKIKQLTSFGKESSFIFNNDNELWILTKRNEDENNKNTIIYKLALDGGEAVKAFDLPILALDIEKLDNDRLLIMSIVDKNYPNYFKLSDKEKQLIDKQYKDDTDYELFDEVPFYFNNAGYLKNRRRALFIYDLKKKKLNKITEDLYSVDSYEIMKDKIYYSGASYDTLQKAEKDIRYYDLKNNKTYNVYPDKYSIYTLIKFNDELLALVNKADKTGMNQNPRLYKVNLKTKKLEIFNDEDRTYGNTTGSDVRYGASRDFKVVDDRLYFVETRNYQNVLVYFDSKGKAHDVYTADGAIDDFDIYKDKIVLNLLNEDHPQELYLLKDNKLKLLSHFNDAAMKGKYVAKLNILSYKSAKYNLDGWVLYPKDFDPKKKYPAVLDIHGGPKTVYGQVYYHEMQVWASNGYFVFFTNPYGSDGRGSDFADMRGKYGTTDYKNFMDFTDVVLEKYKNIDKKRVCVTGGSYGGFMTNWIVGHTDRFVCAATQRSICNWISFIGTSDIGLRFAKDQCAADLNNIEKLWYHSPLKYVNNVKTPILFIHSDEDYRCPLEQGLQYYTAINDKGVDTKMVIFHGENHELSRSGKPLHRIKRLTEITNWFERYTR